jgi:hypothetical protein
MTKLRKLSVPPPGCVEFQAQFKGLSDTLSSMEDVLQKFEAGLKPCHDSSAKLSSHSLIHTQITTNANWIYWNHVHTCHRRAAKDKKSRARQRGSKTRISYDTNKRKVASFSTSFLHG